MKFQTFFTVLWIGLLNVIVAISGDWPDATMSSEVLQRAEARAQRVTTAIRNIPMFARNPRFVYWYKHGRTETVRCADLQFVHIFKNAGTLLKDKMVHYCGAILCSHAPKHQRCTEDYRSVQLTNAFGVLRDPIDRFLSGYHEAFKRMRPSMRPKFRSPDCRLDYFRYFVRRQMTQVDAINPHLQPQYSFLLERPEGPVVKVNRLFLMEELDALNIPHNANYDDFDKQETINKHVHNTLRRRNSTYLLNNFDVKRHEIDTITLRILCQHLYIDYQYVVADDYLMPRECLVNKSMLALHVGEENATIPIFENQCWTSPKLPRRVQSYRTS